MSTFGRFAKYYDLIYRGIVDYEADCDYLEALFRKFLAAEPVTILDLGCGTGNHATSLARRGYDVTGLDLSAAQLRSARAKVRASWGRRIRFVRGDMERFDLHRRFEAAICMFGGFGYLLTDRQLASHLASVRRHLAPGGIYTFEFWHGPGAFDHHVSWVHRQRPVELIRLDESRSDRRHRRLTMTFRFFVFDGGRLVDRFAETHVVRLYTVPEIRRELARSGFGLLAAYGTLGTKKGFSRPTKSTFRITAVVKSLPKP